MVYRSAPWDNRISQHFAVWEYANEYTAEGEEDESIARNGACVTSLAGKSAFDLYPKSQR